MLILSAHPDDAILSATYLLKDCGKALTLFTGSPDREGFLSRWDDGSGFSTSHEASVIRGQEDRSAFAEYGLTVRQLGLPEFEYRSAGAATVNWRAALSIISSEVAGVDAIAIPMGIGSHPDHIICRELALSTILKLDSPPAVHFYADYPYVRLGDSSIALADADRVIDRMNGKYGKFLGGKYGMVTTTLDQQSIVKKRAAIGCYASQIGPLQSVCNSNLLEEAWMGVESAWIAQ